MTRWLYDGLYTINHLPLWRRPTRLWGHRMVPPSADRLLHLWLHRLGMMGQSVRKTLASLVRPGMRVIDIGANQGVFTMLLSELVKPAGTVDAFEPDPALFDALRANLDRNNVANVVAHRVALADRAGSLQLGRSVLNSGDNRLGGTSPFTRAIEVPLDTLDRRVSHPVDFIKLDVQGYELAVLRGAAEVLERSGRLTILTEFWPAGIRLAGAEPAELLTFLTDRGFRLYAPDDWSRTRQINHWLAEENECDILAVRE